MKVLFASGNGYYPEFSGGVQSSTHHLAQQLRADGHNPAVLAALFGDGLFGFKARAKMKLFGAPAVIDGFPGYPVARAWFPWEAAEYVARKLRPDVAVVQCQKSVPIAKALQAQNVPIVIYLRNVEFNELAGDLRDLRPALYIANSEFTAKTYKETFGITATVIPPTIDPALYKTDTTLEYVTFINPCSAKGFELAVRIAEQCPEIPFLFVESWKLETSQRQQIEKTIAPFENIHLKSRTSDMKTIYGRTKILLAPSKWEEAWGRVASEAQCSGIPVVGSRRGGLPEAIGKGGIILDYEAPVEDWSNAVRLLWRNDDEYRRLSFAALEFSRRPQLQSSLQYSTFLDLLIRASATCATYAGVGPAQQC
ncbi:glycosyltransferase [Rhizobium hainanense]|uniref:Glycosyltransferase involved in cell wall bisynthesis n=1 Tax=Rhizobium hainanense TaxID=52131 RepID=A0A1C3VI26_9HYPH|nr:glycosyltransferase [Rhizobium hainanense]SCB27359.1 Glycosyltransferase involved in cell wall bisynthesis [Rhizobium hainanense]